VGGHGERARRFDGQVIEKHSAPLIHLCARTRRWQRKLYGEFKGFLSPENAVEYFPVKPI